MKLRPKYHKVMVANHNGTAVDVRWRLNNPPTSTSPPFEVDDTFDYLFRLPNATPRAPLRELFPPPTPHNLRRRDPINYAEVADAWRSRAAARRRSTTVNTADIPPSPSGDTVSDPVDIGSVTASNTTTTTTTNTNAFQSSSAATPTGYMQASTNGSRRATYGTRPATYWSPPGCYCVGPWPKRKTKHTGPKRTVVTDEDRNKAERRCGKCERHKCQVCFDPQYWECRRCKGEARA